MNDKELVANEALKYVKNGMTIGLGTGSTANIFIEALAKKIKEESLDVKVVASSTVSQLKAQEVGLDYISLDQISKIKDQFHFVSSIALSFVDIIQDPIL